MAKKIQKLKLEDYIHNMYIKYKNNKLYIYYFFDKFILHIYYILPNCKKKASLWCFFFITVIY